uniref:Uncharacterized protein n=1 Tax=Heterosigma akashiwo TaxID=2829 RepID=A0A7S3Y6V0_HETAK
MASQRASYQKFTSQCSEDTVTSEGWASSFFYSSSKDTAVNETRSSECNVLRSSACSLCICCKGCPCDVSYGAAGFMVVGATVALVVVASVAKIARKKARPSSVHVPLSSPPQLSPAVVSEPQSSRRATPVPQSKNQGQLETARNKFSGEDEVKFKLLSSVQQLENNGIISKQEAERQRASIQRKFSVPSAPMTSFWALCWYSAAAFAILATALTLLEKPGILRTLLLTPMTLLFRVDALAKACLLLVAAAALAWNAPKAPAHLDGLVDFLTAGFLAAALGAWNLLVLDTGRWENETAQGDAGSLLWWRWTVGLTAVALGGLAGALRSECFFQLAFHAAAAWAALMAALAGQCESWGGLGALERLAACFAAQAVAWRALARFHAAPEEAPARRRSFVDEVKELEKKEGGSPGGLARLWARGLGSTGAAARQLAGWGAKGSSLAATYALIFLWVAAGPLISNAAQPRGEADTTCATRAPILSYLATCLCVVGTAVYAARWHSISAWNFFLYGSTVLFVLHTWPVLADVPESVDLDYWLGMNLPVRLSVLTGSVLFLSVEGGVGGPLWAALGRLASVSRAGASVSRAGTGAGTPLKESPNALVKRAQASLQNPNWQGQACPRPGPSSAPPPLAPPDFRAATRLWASRWLLVALWCVQLQGNYGLRAWREGALDLESRGGPRYAGRARLLGWGLPLLAAAGGFLLSGARAALRAEAAGGGGGGGPRESGAGLAERAQQGAGAAGGRPCGHRLGGRRQGL